jgi:hypothetical protein
VGGFESIKGNLEVFEIAGRKCRLISLPDLVRAKEAMGREKDLLAAKELRAIAAMREKLLVPRGGSNPHDFRRQILSRTGNTILCDVSCGSLQMRIKPCFTECVWTRAKHHRVSMMVPKGDRTHPALSGGLRAGSSDQFRVDRLKGGLQEEAANCCSPHEGLARAASMGPNE